jgi:hypothetical protein
MGPGNGFIASQGTVATGTNAVGVPLSAGSLTNLRVFLSTNPGSSPNSYTFNVCVDNNCAVSGRLACTVNGPAGITCSDSVDSMTITDGQRVSMQATNNSSPTQVTAGWSMRFTPSAP